MSNLKKIVILDKSIKKKKRWVSKKKKSIPYFIGALILIYLAFINLIEIDKPTTFFKNQTDYIIIVSSIFFGILLVYFTYLYYRISNLRKLIKQQNISMFKLNRLNKEND
jgi:hypothetical protein